MPNHYSDIGFIVNGADDFCNILDNLCQHSNKISAKHGDYLLAKVDNHIEFWIQCSKAGKIIGLEMHYSSDNVLPVRFERLIKQKQASKLSERIQVWHGETFPIVLDVPNMDLHGKLKKNSTINMQISAFADSPLTLFDSEEEYDKAQESEEIKWAAECFVPMGMFMTGKKVPYEATAMFAGFIKSFEKCSNSYSGKDYYHFEVRCQSAIFDVVADPECVDKHPKVGGILKGEFWMSGKIL